MTFHDIYHSTLDLLRAGEGRTKILTHLAQHTEKLIGKGSAVSILLLDKKGLLRNGASPALPGDYLAAIDGIRPDPRVGTCAAAAATGKMIVTPDFRADDKWAELRHLPLSIGYAGAWSMPIKNNDGKVLGTLGTYYKDVRKPSEEEIEGVGLLTTAVSAVLAVHP